MRLIVLLLATLLGPVALARDPFARCAAEVEHLSAAGLNQGAKRARGMAARYVAQEAADVRAVEAATQRCAVAARAQPEEVKKLLDNLVLARSAARLRAAELDMSVFRDHARMVKQVLAAFEASVHWTQRAASDDEASERVALRRARLYLELEQQRLAPEQRRPVGDVTVWARDAETREILTQKLPVRAICVPVDVPERARVALLESGLASFPERDALARLVLSAAGCSTGSGPPCLDVVEAHLALLASPPVSPVALRRSMGEVEASCPLDRLSGLVLAGQALAATGRSDEAERLFSVALAIAERTQPKRVPLIQSLQAALETTPPLVQWDAGAQGALSGLGCEADPTGPLAGQCALLTPCTEAARAAGAIPIQADPTLPPNRFSAELWAAFKARLDAHHAAERACLAIQAESPEARAAVQVSLALAHEALALAIRTSTTPAELNPDQLDLYQMALIDKAYPYEERARISWEQAAILVPTLAGPLEAERRRAQQEAYAALQQARLATVERNLARYGSPVAPRHYGLRVLGWTLERLEKATQQRASCLDQELGEWAAMVLEQGRAVLSENDSGMAWDMVSIAEDLLSQLEAAPLCPAP